MIKLTLPFWMLGPKATALIVVLQAWWVQVESWLSWPLLQLDMDTAALAVVELVGWGRGITRFVGETDSLFRKRVKFAFINAQDAGSVAGFIRIFERLEIGYVEVDERVAGDDWDVIHLLLNDSQLAQNAALLDAIIQLYGRTCRRYVFDTIVTAQGFINVQTMSHNHQTVVASA